MPQHLILRLEAPMVSFGGETIDNRGVVRDFPALSMLTGLVANALGWDRSEGARLDSLQGRIDFAAARLRPGHRRQDYQTARLFEKDAGWTSRNRPEGRASSPSFTWDAEWAAERGQRAKSLTHQRYRDFDADSDVLVALALNPADDAPTLEQIAEALLRPERPLFLGRKPFLPSGPILWTREIEAPNAIGALCLALDQRAAKPVPEFVPAQWSPGPEDIPGQWRQATPTLGLRVEQHQRVADIRRHVEGVHAGARTVAVGVVGTSVSAVAT
jgi:CRISPR system Cascade subunit CasD